MPGERPSRREVWRQREGGGGGDGERERGGGGRGGERERGGGGRGGERDCLRQWGHLVSIQRND